MRGSRKSSRIGRSCSQRRQPHKAVQRRRRSPPAAQPAEPNLRAASRDKTARLRGAGPAPREAMCLPTGIRGPMRGDMKIRRGIVQMLESALGTG